MDFLAAANLENGDPEPQLQSISKFFNFLTGEQSMRFYPKPTSRLHEYDPAITDARAPVEAG